MATITTVPLSKRYMDVRNVTMNLIKPLESEDFIIQSHPDISPPKWHIAHTTWFFERFILKEYVENYKEFHSTFDFLFNSYYETVGPFQPRHQRGVLSRPNISQVLKYRSYVDEHIVNLLTAVIDTSIKDKINSLVEIGIQHEQQHQELILMDIKYNFFVNPLHPSYNEKCSAISYESKDNYVLFEGGLVEIGHNGKGFSFDNEMPRHKVWIDSFKLATNPVTNGDYLEFIDAGGYEKPEFWLSDGWNAVKKNNWKAPLYWIKDSMENWNIFTLSGMTNLTLNDPVCHVSFYEADAFSRWKGKRLPTEAEWEHASHDLHIQGNTLEDGFLHPFSVDNEGEVQLSGMFGDVWEWTASSYSPYPGSKPLEGALGEYNAKFMCNQMVLRGGSCVTPLSHLRKTYRNFFPAEKRWQFSGIRLAEDVQ